MADDQSGASSWLDPLYAPFKPRQDEPAWLGDDAAVVEHVLNRPDGIRQRALNSATIAGGAAAALAALAAVAGVGSRAGIARIAVAVALLLWLGSVFFYIQAITYSWRRGRVDKAQPVEVPAVPAPGGASAQGDEERAQMLKEFVEYADNMRARVRLGSIVASLAVVATIAAVVAIAVDSAAAGDDTVQAVWLTPKAAAALPACARKERHGGAVKVVAEAKVGDLAKPVLPMKIACMDGRTYRVPRRAIVATEQKP